jgi:hypothetical protein
MKKKETLGAEAYNTIKAEIEQKHKAKIKSNKSQKN